MTVHARPGLTPTQLVERLLAKLDRQPEGSTRGGFDSGQPEERLNSEPSPAAPVSFTVTPRPASPAELEKLAEIPQAEIITPLARETVSLPADYHARAKNLNLSSADSIGPEGSQAEAGRRWRDWLYPSAEEPHRRGLMGALRSPLGGGVVLTSLLVLLLQFLALWPSLLLAAFFGGWLSRTPLNGLGAGFLPWLLVLIFSSALERGLIASVFTPALFGAGLGGSLAGLGGLVILRTGGYLLILVLLAVSALGGFTEWLRQRLRLPAKI